jgi:uncharacterized membrane protein YfcA
MLAVFAVGLWGLALVAGRPAGRAIALELPPVSACAWVTGVVLAAIGGLTLWRRTWSRRAAQRRAERCGQRETVSELSASDR